MTYLVEGTNEMSNIIQGCGIYVCKKDTCTCQGVRCGTNRPPCQCNGPFCAGQLCYPVHATPWSDNAEI